MHKSASKYELFEMIISLIKTEIQQTPEDTNYTIALSGGSTPKDLYSEMAAKIPEILRAKVCFLQVDERMVPPEHEDSNQKMIREALIIPANIPDKCFLSINTLLDHESARDEYAQKLLNSSFIKTVNHRPRIDCMILGMGSDGHTASLFSDKDCEIEGIVAATIPQELPYKRVSLTLGTILNAGKFLFLVTGKSKAEKVKELDSGGNFPAAKVLQSASDAHFYCDEEAASRL